TGFLCPAGAPAQYDRNGETSIVAVTPAGDKVAILDRDGTIVRDRGYLDNAAGLEFAPGAAAGLRCLHMHGYRLVVITNQSGVGRGLYPIERVHEMNDRLHIMV